MTLPDDQTRQLRERLSQNRQKRGNITPEKKGFDYAEYAKRINGDIDATTRSSLAKKQERIKGELESWHSRAGARFSNAKIQDPRVQKIIDGKIQNMKSGLYHANSLIMVGRLGVGKTWTSFAYIENMIREGLVADSEVFLGTEAETLQRITRSGFRQPEEEAKLLDRRYKVFFIDEVGRTEYRNQDARENIWLMLVNHAYQHNIPLIITSNLPTATKKITDARTGAEREVSPLEAWIGDAAMDRLRYMVGDDGVIAPRGENMRSEANRWFDSGKTNDQL